MSKNFASNSWKHFKHLTVPKPIFWGDKIIKWCFPQVCTLFHEVYLEVDEIYWSHGSIKKTFRNGESLKNTLDELCDKYDGLEISDFPLIDVVERDIGYGHKYYAVTGTTFSFSKYFCMLD